jgi:diadenosine tetraphosphatase ApaH/serine/threonine PP2A family protein phosphatase
VLQTSRALLSTYDDVHIVSIQSHWRGARARLQAAMIFYYMISAGLEAHEERLASELGAFLCNVHLPHRTSHSLSRGKMIGDSTSCSLPFPLSEAAVVAMVRAMERGESLITRSLSELLERQVALLKALPNVIKYTIPNGAMLCVVGDLHGQLDDLLYIFRRHGFPSPSRPYLFNGDFVDRGPRSVEIVTILFAFQQLCPGAVMLNRGNHEERNVYTVYGFERECKHKYDPGIYEAFGMAFDHLPLATIVNRQVIVVHGGIDSELTIPQLEACPRHAYVSVKKKTEAISWLMHARASKMPSIKPIHSVLWNDPAKACGTATNDSRGTGLTFGPDVLAAFLKRNQLGFVIRSHEAVMEGYAYPFGPAHPLVTLFSASNYGGRSKNKGAFALLSAESCDHPAESTTAPLIAPAAPAAQSPPPSAAPSAVPLPKRSASAHANATANAPSPARLLPKRAASANTQAAALQASTSQHSLRSLTSSSLVPSDTRVVPLASGGTITFVQYEAKALSRVQMEQVHALTLPNEEIAVAPSD